MRLEILSAVSNEIEMKLHLPNMKLVRKRVDFPEGKADDSSSETGQTLIFLLDNLALQQQIDNALQSVLNESNAEEILLVANIRCADDEVWLRKYCARFPSVNAILNRRAKSATVLEAQGRWLARYRSQEVLSVDLDNSGGKILRRVLPFFTPPVAMEMQKSTLSCQPGEQGLTLIIPAHDCDLYLTDCLASALAIESDKTLVVVDDGSLDDTHGVIAGFASQYPEIIDHISICKASGLPAVPRNIGLASMQTDTFGFIDADDWISPGEYTSALYEMQQMSADIATAAGFTRHYPDRIESLLQKCFTIPENEPAKVLDGSFFSNIWNRIYSRNILLRSGAHFPRTHFSEDFCFSVWSHFYAEKTIQVSVSFYHHRYGRQGSTTDNRAGLGAFDHITEFHRELEMYLANSYMRKALATILRKRMGSFQYTLKLLPPELIQPFKTALQEMLEPLNRYFISDKEPNKRDIATFAALGISDLLYQRPRSKFLGMRNWGKQ